VNRITENNKEKRKGLRRMKQNQWIGKEGIIERLKNLEKQVKKLEETFEARLKEEKEEQKNMIIKEIDRMNHKLELLQRKKWDDLWNGDMYYPRKAI